jgi:hypothetical protein
MIGSISRSRRMRLGLHVACVTAALAVVLPAAALARGSQSTAIPMCQRMGWTHLVRADLTPFASQRACMSYRARGGRWGQTITFTSADPSPVLAAAGATYVPAASATSGLRVAFRVDAASSSVCQMSRGVVSFMAAGTCLIDARQGGSWVWAPAAQAQQSISVVIGEL